MRNELGELVHIVGSAHCRKLVVAQVIDVDPHPLVRVKECHHVLSIVFI